MARAPHEPASVAPSSGILTTGYVTRFTSVSDERLCACSMGENSVEGNCQKKHGDIDDKTSPVSLKLL